MVKEGYAKTNPHVMIQTKCEPHDLDPFYPDDLDFDEDYGISENNILGLPNGNLSGLPITSRIAAFNISGFSGTGAPGWLPNGPGRIANMFDTPTPSLRSAGFTH